MKKGQGESAVMHPRFTVVVWGVFAILLTTFGCGKATYEDAMKKRMTSLAFESKFMDYLQPQPTEIITDVASLRLPTIIDGDATTLTVGKRDRQRVPIDPRRIQPPGITIPGFRYSYERFIQLEGRNNLQPIYVYVGSVPATDKQGKVLNAILKGARAFSKTASWVEETIDTPDQQKLTVQKLSIKGSQDFELNEKGGDIRKAPGQLDVYVHSTPEFHIIVGFRGTNDAADASKIFEAAPIALGTLTVEVAANDEATDS